MHSMRRYAAGGKSGRDLELCEVDCAMQFRPLTRLHHLVHGGSHTFALFPRFSLWPHIEIPVPCDVQHEVAGGGRAKRRLAFFEVSCTVCMLRHAISSRAGRVVALLAHQRHIFARAQLMLLPAPPAVKSEWWLPRILFAGKCFSFQSKQAR